VGRIPNGASIERAPVRADSTAGSVVLSLYNPDYTTVERVKESINNVYPECALTVDDASVSMKIPQIFSAEDGRVKFIAAIENLTVNPDMRAKVVINEKTGTIVAGEHVTIAPIALAHGNITVEIKSTPVISQPSPLSQGETVSTQENHINVSEEKARVVYLEERTDISEIASALNAIGASPRDIIAIFQAIKQAGALRAELIVL
jgi:flagellar P-ring protein precursor FlgI